MSDEITRVLSRLNEGDTGAAEELFELVHGELRGLAHGKMKGQRRNHTLQATALVNEAYLRLLGDRSGDWENRKHFFAAAARAMRSILVDYARYHTAEKRGGGRRQEPLTPDLKTAEDASLVEVLAVHDALEKLEGLDARKCRVVELLYWIGLTAEEVGRVLGISAGTVKREWRFARAWLLGEIRQ